MNNDFLNTVMPGAIQGYTDYGILPSITVAQGILESTSGTSELSRITNNLFGIKGTGTRGSYQTQTGTYRVYNTPVESVIDHNKIVGTQDNFAGVRKATNYKDQAYALKAGKYAEDPNYAEKLINVINENQLYKLDQAVTSKSISKVNINGIDYDVSNLPKVNPSGGFVNNTNGSAINVLRPGEKPTETNQVNFGSGINGIVAGISSIVTKILFIVAGLIFGYLAVKYLLGSED